LKKTIQLLIGLLIAVGALYYTLSNVSGKELMASLETVEWVYLLPSILIIVSTYIFRVYRWQILLMPMQEIRISELSGPLMVGFMSNILPGRAGEFIRAYLIKQRSSISFSGAFATIVVERLFDLIMMLLMFIWLFAFRADVFSTKAQTMGISVRDLAIKFGQAGVGLIFMLVLFIYFLVWHKAALMKLIHWIEKRLPEKWNNRIEYWVEEFSLGLSVIKKPKSLFMIALYTVLVWISITFTFYPLYWAYDLQDKSMDSLVLVTVMVGIFITVLPTPAFLGSTNAAILISLHNIMGEDELKAVSFGMVSWALGFFVMAIGGIYYLFRDHLSFGKLVQAEEILEKTENPDKLD